MKKYALPSLVAILVLLLTLCACSSPDKAAVTSSDISGSDISGSDISATDISAAEISSSDLLSSLSGDELAVAQVIVSSTDAFNREDINAYMATVDPDSDAYDATRDAVELVFDRYQLKAAIDKLDVKEISGDTATVSVTQTTAPFEDGKASFTPVQTTLTHTLIKRGGEWFITSTVVESRTELVDYWGLFKDFVSSAGLTSASDALPTDEAGELDRQ